MFMIECTEFGLQVSTDRDSAGGRREAGVQPAERRVKDVGMYTSVCHMFLLPLRPGHCNNEDFESCVSMAVEGSLPLLDLHVNAFSCQAAK